MGVIKDFFRVTFLKDQKAIDIDEVPEASDGGHESSSAGAAVARKRAPQYDPDESARRDIVIWSNRILAAVLLLGFGFVVVYPFLNPDRNIPDVIQNVVSGCIGYFGSTVTMFLGRRRTRS